MKEGKRKARLLEANAPIKEINGPREEKSQLLRKRKREGKREKERRKERKSEKERERKKESERDKKQRERKTECEKERKTERERKEEWKKKERWNSPSNFLPRCGMAMAMAKVQVTRKHRKTRSKGFFHSSLLILFRKMGQMISTGT